MPKTGRPNSEAIGAIDSDKLYTRQFLGIALAVGLFMTGVSLQFHFGEYVAFLGHGVDTLGHIVSFALIGTLLLRMQLGRWIDRFGCRKTWFLGTTAVTICLVAIQVVGSFWLLVLLRALWAMGVALVMTTVPVLAAQIASPLRRAESIGTIGIAGFIGMIIGPALGDWILPAGTVSQASFHLFFTTSAVCSVLAGLAMAAVARGITQSTFQTSSNVPIRMTMWAQMRMVLRHWPGMILLVSMLFNMVFCIQALYLERLAAFGGFHNIKLFFFVYCPTAVALRLVFRQLPQTFGRTRTVFCGLVLLAGGLLCLVGVQSEHQLILPGLLMGAGHCFVFPSMVDLAAARFPVEHRGTGTAVAFTAGDLGTLIGFLVLGEVIDTFGFDRALQLLAAACTVTALTFVTVRRSAVFSKRIR